MEVLEKDLKGKVIHRPTDWLGNQVGTEAKINDYVVATYGYGSSSHPDRNNPAAVIYAKNEDDIKKAIQYAYDNKIAVSCRSGGHQYGVFCLTTEENITIDVSSFNQCYYDEREDVFVAGAGCDVHTVISTLKSKGCFVPHGECGEVKVGGHMQTGGYSPFFSRSFGFMCDNITEFTIIMPPTKDGEQPQKVVVTKPPYPPPKSGDSYQAKNADIWFAVQGGSPGNIGVVTEMKIKAIKDENHKDVRAMSFAFIYEKKDGAGKKRFQKFLQIMSKYSDDDNLPADYVFNVFVLKGNPSWKTLTHDRQNLDVKMATEHPETYGQLPPKVYAPPVVCMIVNWNNLQGDKVKFEDTYEDENGNKYCAKEIFEEIRNEVHEGKPHLPHWMEMLADLLKRVVGHIFFEVLNLKEDKPMTLSELDSKCVFGPRYGLNPYVGMHRWNTSLPLSTNGWVEKTATILDAAVWGYGTWPTPQWGNNGGRHSAVRPENAKNPNCLVGRLGNVSNLYYVHYDNVRDGKDVKEPRENALKSIEDMGIMCDKGGVDGGPIVGPKRTKFLAFCGEDEDLDAVHEDYYETEEDYLKLLQIKRKYDPRDVFTPNLFCVGASRKFGTAPAGSPALGVGDKRPATVENTVAQRSNKKPKMAP